MEFLFILLAPQILIKLPSNIMVHYVVPWSILILNRMLKTSGLVMFRLCSDLACIRKKMVHLTQINKKTLISVYKAKFGSKVKYPKLRETRQNMTPLWTKQLSNPRSMLKLVEDVNIRIWLPLQCSKNKHVTLGSHSTDYKQCSIWYCVVW